MESPAATPETKNAQPTNESVRRSRTSSPYTYAYIAVAFFLGLSLGVFATVFGLRYFLFHMQPIPQEIARNTTMRISDDFKLSPQTRDQVEKILVQGHEEVFQTLESTEDKVDEIKLKIAKQIAALIPEGEQREQWMHDYLRYFPSPPRFRAGGLPPDDRGGPGLSENGPHPFDGKRGMFEGGPRRFDGPRGGSEPAMKGDRPPLPPFREEK